MERIRGCVVLSVILEASFRNRFLRPPHRRLKMADTRENSLLLISLLRIHNRYSQATDKGILKCFETRFHAAPDFM